MGNGKQLEVQYWKSRETGEECRLICVAGLDTRRINAILPTRYEFVRAKRYSRYTLIDWKTGTVTWVTKNYQGHLAFYADRAEMVQDIRKWKYEHVWMPDPETPMLEVDEMIHNYF